MSTAPFPKKKRAHHHGHWRSQKKSHTKFLDHVFFSRTNPTNPNSKSGRKNEKGTLESTKKSALPSPFRICPENSQTKFPSFSLAARPSISLERDGPDHGTGVRTETPTSDLTEAFDSSQSSPSLACSVLGSFLAALNKFIADRYSWNHSVSEYHVYEFFKIWNCSRERANFLVHEFFTTHYFQDGIHPIPGARDALQTLSSFCSLSVVTSRQDVIKNHTLEWIEKYYPGLFEQIHFGNHFALEGQSRPKSEICRSFGAQVLIDDNPRYALECANDGMRVLLFDYESSYPWCKTGADELHPLVTKVHNWEEVEEKLLSWVVPDSWHSSVLWEALLETSKWFLLPGF